MGKLNAVISCFDCGRRTAKFGEVVQDVKPERNNGKPFIVGYRCIKCTRKKFAGGTAHRQDEVKHGQGWRQRFFEFVENIRKTKKQSAK